MEPPLETDKGIADGSSLGVDVGTEFSKRLWGEAYLDPTTRTFQKRARDCTPVDSEQPIQRTFCQFVLNPIYKIYAACLGESESSVKATLRSVGILLSRINFWPVLGV